MTAPMTAPGPTDPANAERRALLSSILDEAIAAAHPRKCLVGHLPAPTPGRLIILGAGKAGGSMAAVASRFYRQEHGVPEDRIVGLAVARHGYGEDAPGIRMVEAGHPVPDAAGIEATRKRSPSPRAPARRTRFWCCSPAAARRTGSRRPAT
ncbi:hypothetical protein GCM10025880_58590 [Methylorubrum aminovorans]|nr:hypothetical protein GCM10025880_58590 [Methylorubrum aminovorans]